MAETNFSALDSTGSSQQIDTYKPAGGNQRQAVVLSDPTTSANIAPVQSTDPASNSAGIVVRDVNTSAIVGVLNSGVSVTGTLTGITNTVAVYFSGSNPSVNVGTPTITGITNSINVYLGATAGTVNVALKPGTIAVSLDPGHELGSIKGINSSVAVYFDRGNPAVTVSANTATLSVYIPDTGHELGSIRGINSTVAVYFSGSNPAVNVGTPSVYNLNSTAGAYYFASGSYNGNSVSGGTVISPATSHVNKIYAIALTTTAQTHIVAKFTNGAGTGPTEYWRYAVQAPSQGVSGANLSVTPPAYLFATASGSTLSLVLDSAGLVHYSVGYFRESA